MFKRGEWKEKREGSLGRVLASWVRGGHTKSKAQKKEAELEPMKSTANTRGRGRSVYLGTHALG